MPPAETLGALQRRHAAERATRLAPLLAEQTSEEHELLEDALVTAEWAVSRVARTHGCALSTVQDALRRHPDLREEHARRVAERPRGPLRRGA